MASTSPVSQFETLLENNKFVFAIYYRGHWCPFCMAWIRKLEELSPTIKAEGGVPVIITAELEKHLQATLKKTKYSGEAIVDPENQLAKELKRRSILDVAISSRPSYKHGMAQPAVLAMKKDGTVLESWAIVPSLMNLGGGTDRPVLEEVWANVQEKMKGKDEAHKSYTRLGWLRLFREKVSG